MKDIESGERTNYARRMVPDGVSPLRVITALPIFSPAGGWGRPLTPVAHAVSVRLVDVQLDPDTNSLPGGQLLQNLMNGVGGWALALALVGLVIGAAAWAL